MDVDSMKYTELQKLAKELGLKANLKADKLLKLIKQHHQRPTSEEEHEHEQVQEKDNGSEQQEDRVEEKTEAVPSTDVFVNTRRGRRNGTKRKISDTQCDAKLPAVEDVTEVEASAQSCGNRRAKKRKVSAVKDNEPESPEQPQLTGTEQQQLQEEAEEQQEQQEQQEEADVNHQDTERGTTAGTKAGKIPRHHGLLQKKKLKPVTPNFKKLHEAHFNKMESIDSYVQRKNKQIDTYRTSAKQLKKLPEKSQQQQPTDKSQPKTKQTRASMFSPSLVSKKPAEDVRRHTLLSATKAAVFRPSVLSTRKINVRFSEATHDNEYKKSLMKTPARMSPCVSSTRSPHKPSTFSATKTSGPFVFTGNCSMSTTPGSQKNTFDLKASLSRPLTYKPHTGKLKAFCETKEKSSVAANKSLVSNYKQHQVQTRENRREKHAADRAQKKQKVLGARRGLVMM